MGTVMRERDGSGGVEGGGGGAGGGCSSFSSCFISIPSSLKLQDCFASRVC